MEQLQLVQCSYEIVLIHSGLIRWLVLLFHYQLLKKVSAWTPINKAVLVIIYHGELNTTDQCALRFVAKRVQQILIINSCSELCGQHYSIFCCSSEHKTQSMGFLGASVKSDAWIGSLYTVSWIPSIVVELVVSGSV